MTFYKNTYDFAGGELTVLYWANEKDTDGCRLVWNKGKHGFAGEADMKCSNFADRKRIIRDAYAKMLGKVDDRLEHMRNKETLQEEIDECVNDLGERALQRRVNELERLQ